MDLHKIIQDALYEFIQSYIPDADLRYVNLVKHLGLCFVFSCHAIGVNLMLLSFSTLDEVLLSYITGVLEDLGSQGSVEENFDVEVFVEMLEAYIPGFAEIDR